MAKVSSSNFTMKGNTMLLQILGNTPLSVWGLLLGLIALGVSQLFTRTVRLRRIALMPIAMAGLSIYGTVSTFGGAPEVLISWLAAAWAAVWAAWQLPMSPAIRYDSSMRQFTLPGSWMPLMSIIGIFLVKYIAGVALAMQPALAHNAAFGLVVAFLYGAFSGIFIARAARLLRLTWRQENAQADSISAAGNQ
jgi:hypothetical protein